MFCTPRPGHSGSGTGGSPILGDGGGDHQESPSFHEEMDRLSLLLNQSAAVSGAQARQSHPRI
eukprot:scaffold249764_cov19-Prasinocladus_malaysianus.AAC.1